MRMMEQEIHTLLDSTEFLLKIDVERGGSHLFLIDRKDVDDLLMGTTIKKMLTSVTS